MGIYLIRHAKTLTPWSIEPDSPLSPHGISQAQALGESWRPPKVDVILTSPLKRALQTAEIVASIWSANVKIEKGLGEIPCPHSERSKRQTFLETILKSDWSDIQTSPIHQWRSEVLQTARELSAPTVAITHYLTINAIYGATTSNNAVDCFNPAHCTPVEFNRTTLRGLEP